MASCGDKNSVLSDEEYLKIGDKIQRAVYQGNSNYLKELIHQNTVEANSFANLNLRKARERRYREEIKKRFASMMSSLVETVQYGGVFELVSLSSHPNPRLLFAHYNDHLNFIEFELKTIGKKTYIIDFYSFYSGEYFSNSLKQHILNEIEYGNLGGLYANALEELYNVQGFVKRGNYERAWRAYGRIPFEFQQQKTFGRVRVDLSKNISPEAYISSLEDFIDLNNEDKRFTALQNLNLLIAKKEPEKALQSLKRLEEYVGRSQLLQFIEAQLLHETGNSDDAMDRINSFIKSVDYFFPAYIKKLEILLTNTDYKGATELMALVEAKFTVAREEWEVFLENYPNFIDSKAYKSWVGS